ncbi:MAG: hypothetical protein K0R34_2892 [Herbinix sp.]|jgi:hypothetical protein|nr:hypothetical protein [Herbinix sp.]
MSRTVGLVLKMVETEKEPSKFDGMNVDQLKEYAAEHSIELGNSSSINGIIKKITEAEKEA